jgi:tetratricopeptide (TPR) repeat protein
LAEARRLADLYAEAMLAAADDPVRFDQLKTRMDALLADHADAATPAVQVVLLQAEYQRAEALMIRWVEAPQDRGPLAEATIALGRIAPQLAAAHQDLAAVAETAMQQVEAATGDDAKLSAEQEALRLAAVASRAAYFAGWSSYYLGVAGLHAAAADKEAAQPHFAQAKQMFLTVLELTDATNYEGVEPEGLGLDSVWRTRSAIGLALAEIGLDRLAAAGSIFTWLAHPSVPTELRDQAGYWHVQGLVNVGRYEQAAQRVEALVERFSGPASPGKNSLCIALLRAAAALPPEQLEQRRRLVEPAIRGLARLRQFDTLGQLLEKYKLDAVVDPNSFYVRWLRGRQQFLAAEKTKLAADYEAAAATLQTALRHEAARTELADAAQCRYYWAWCQYRLERLEIAAGAFAEAVPPLKGSLPDVAVQSAWMQCVALQQLAVKDKKQMGAAMTAMQTLIADFARSEQAAKAEFALTRLRQASATPEEAIASLAAVKPGDANYAAALLEICQLRWQLWSKAKADAKKSGPLSDAVLAAVDRLLAAAPEGDPDRRLKAGLLAVDVLSERQPPDRVRIDGYLGKMATAAQRVDPGSTSAAEYHYRRLQQGQHAKDESAAEESARWIVANATGSPYELPALVVAARHADRAVESAAANDRPARAAEAADVYSRLVELLGDSPQALAKTKNALPAAAKLAQYESELGRTKEAATRWSRILEARPDDKNYLRRAGLAHFAAGEHPEALECWRRLLGGLAQGSDEWLEAKYYQLACLAVTDRPAAEKVWRQFRLLFPEVKSPAWRDKFEELARTFM